MAYCLCAKAWDTKYLGEALLAQVRNGKVRRRGYLIYAVYHGRPSLHDSMPPAAHSCTFQGTPVVMRYVYSGINEP